MRNLQIVAAFLPALIAQPAYANEAADVPASERPFQAVQETPNSESLGLSASPSLELSVTQDKQDISLDVSLISSRSRRAPNSALIDTSFHQLTFNAKTTLDEGVRENTILSPKGFAAGTSLELKYTHFWQQTRSAESFKKQRAEALETAIKNCKADPANQSLDAEAIGKECSKANGGLGYLLSRYYPTGYQEINRKTLAKPTTPFAGTSFNGNQTKYSYLDRTSFTIGKSSKFGYEASIFGGLIFRDSPLIARVSFTYAKKYDPADPVNLCQSTTIIGQTQCLEGADGAPTKTEQRTVGLQAFWAFAPDSQNAPRFGIAPSVAYDWKNETLQIDLPVFLARNKERRLTGGIKASYLSEPDPAGGRKDNFIIGVFVGVPLGWGF